MISLDGLAALASQSVSSLTAGAHNPTHSQSRGNSLWSHKEKTKELSESVSMEQTSEGNTRQTQWSVELKLTVIAIASESID